MLPFSEYLRNRSIIAPPVQIADCKLGKKVKIGSRTSVISSSLGDFVELGQLCSVFYSQIDYATYANSNCVFRNAKVGRYCSIGWNAIIGAVQHTLQGTTSYFRQRTASAVVGHDVWIGANSVIFPAVTIGNGAVVGAGAVVKQDIPDYAICVGVPAKIIRYRFSEEIIQELSLVRWWRLPRSVLIKNQELFSSDLTLEKIKQIKSVVENIY